MNLLWPDLANVAPSIPGLSYIENYITELEEDRLIGIIDQQQWKSTLKRRVQHYGYEYDYKSRAVSAKPLGVMPLWLQGLCDKLYKDAIFSIKPNQVIVNEYLPGQGIAPHIDRPDYFGAIICSLSLGSACVMEFIRSSKNPMLLKPRSLIIMEGEARYNWQHSIPARKCDIWEGVRLPRGRRISLTFRNV